MVRILKDSLRLQVGNGEEGAELEAVESVRETEDGARTQGKKCWLKWTKMSPPGGGGVAGTLIHCWWQVKWYNHSEALLEKIKGKRPCTLWPRNSTPGHLSWRSEGNRLPKDTSIYTKLKNRQKSSMMLEVRIAVPAGGEWWLRGATRSLGVTRNVLYRDEGSSYTDLHTCNMLDERTSLDVYWTQI